MPALVIVSLSLNDWSSDLLLTWKDISVAGAIHYANVVIKEASVFAVWINDWKDRLGHVRPVVTRL